MRATLVMPLPDNDITAGLCDRPEVTVADSLPSSHAQTDVNFRRAIMGLGRHELTKQCVCRCVCGACLLMRPRADHPGRDVLLVPLINVVKITCLSDDHVALSSRDLNSEISRRSTRTPIRPIMLFADRISVTPHYSRRRS